MEEFPDTLGWLVSVCEGVSKLEYYKFHGSSQGEEKGDAKSLL